LEEKKERGLNTITVPESELKHKEPAEARKPDKKWVLHVFKGGNIFGPPVPISRKSCYRLGRDAEANDIVTAHETCSKQHAVIQFRETQAIVDGDTTTAVRPYVMDLGSTNGTSLNGAIVEPNHYHELKESDAMKLGDSTRLYVLQLEKY